MRGPRGQAGSIAVELTFIMPLLLLLLALLYGYGRVAQVNGTLEAGTRDAARSASQARSADQARTVAEEAVRSSLGVGGEACLATLKVELRNGLFQAGFPVTIDATCTYKVSDLGLPGLPGSLDAAASFTSPVDPNRGVR